MDREDIDKAKLRIVRGYWKHLFCQKMTDIMHSRSRDGDEGRINFVHQLMDEIKEKNDLTQFLDIKHVLFLVYHFFVNDKDELLGEWLLELTKIIQGVLFADFASVSIKLGEDNIVANGPGYLVIEEKDNKILDKVVAIQFEWEQFLDIVHYQFETKLECYHMILKLFEYAIRVTELEIVE